jgi:type IV pilus assembly protein PilQ
MIRKLAPLLVLLMLLSPLSCTTGGTDSGDDELMSLDDAVDDADVVETDSGEEVADTGDAAVSEEDELEGELDASEQEQPEVVEEAPAEDQPDGQEIAEEEFDELDDQAQPQEQLQEEIAEEPAPEPQEEPVPSPAIEEPLQEQVSLAEITNIKYLANQNGGTVVIETSGPVSYQMRSKPEIGQFVVEINGASLPASLKRPYLLKEFDAAFATINAYQNPGSTTARIVIQAKGQNAPEPVVQQEGNSIVVIPGTPTGPDAGTLAENKQQGEGPGEGTEQIDMKAVEADEKALGARNLDEFLTGSQRFYGRKISIEVTDQDIRDVLNFIATEVGVNVILSEDVQGKVTMKLREIPWDQALITIMKSKKLGYVRQGSIVRISTLASLQEESDSAKKILDSQRILAPLRVKVIPVSYAAVEDLAKQIPPFLTPTRGHVVTDARTSALIITDTEDVLDRVGRLVKELDIPPAQVMIEGKVVEAQDSFTQSLGMNWGYSGSPAVLGEGKGANGADITLFQGLSITNLPPSATGGQTTPFALSLRVGRFDVLGDINAALNLAEQDAIVKILSSPRVVTMNKEKANINQKGQVVTVQTLRDAQGNTTRNPVRTDFSLELSVVPQITAEGSVIMDVDVRREFPGSVADAESGARPINSRAAKTKVLVNDGQTAVIGGIYSSDNTTTETGVPWLRHIPVLGWLFKSRVRADTRNELLIFLTPKILNIKDQAVDG